MIKVLIVQLKFKMIKRILQYNQNFDDISFSEKKTKEFKVNL